MNAMRDAADARSESRVAAWRCRLIGDRTLAIEFPMPFTTISWAPLGAGLKRARVILNHQVELDDRAATEAPRSFLSHMARALGYSVRDTVALMTGAEVAKFGAATLNRQGITVGAWCTAGCTNALRVGDRATVSSSPIGTINLIVAINCTFTEPALIEALQIAVEARVAAMLEARVKSTMSNLPATGTGTDCVVIAAPAAAAAPIQYCGKHTTAGELIGQAAMRSCAQALARSSE